MGLSKVLYSSADIAVRAAQLGGEIAAAYRGSTRPLVVMVVLDGALVFAADLVRSIELPLHIHTVKVKTYQGQFRLRTPHVYLGSNAVKAIRGNHVLVVEDIWDTGHTLRAVVKAVQRRGPLSVTFAAALSKQPSGKVDCGCDGWVGFECPDKFVVGYGMDQDNLHRNLPFIGYFE